MSCAPGAEYPPNLPTVPAKTILSGWQDNGWLGAHYNMNLYRGCSHGCIYCDSRSECYGVEDFDTVHVKRDALAILERELRARRRAGVVMHGSMSDPYNPIEQTLELTRGALFLLERNGFGANLITKSSLVTRDVDILRAIGRGAPAAVSFTITTAEDSLCRKLEPNVCPTSQRLAAMETLARAGIRVGVTLLPVLPFINDSQENILTILRRARECGARWVHPWGGFGVTLRQNQRDYFLTQAERLFPGMRRRYEDTYGHRYQCTIPDNKRIWRLFTAECTRLGVVYESKAVGRAVCKGYFEDGQLSLF